MEMKTLLATFALVFIAELGDKTQLTALGFAAKTGRPWSVFLGTSLALVLAAAMAAAAGEALNRFLPQRPLHILAGVMFVLVGVLLLVNEARKYPETAAVPGTAKTQANEIAGHGALSRLVLRQAARFEHDFAHSLQEYASRLSAGQLRHALEQTASGHRGHGEKLEAINGDLADRLDTDAKEEAQDALPKGMARGLPCGDPVAAQEVLRAAVEIQENAAEYYIALGRIASIQSARAAFQWLAMDELRHARRLLDLAPSLEPQDDPDQGAA